MALSKKGALTLTTDIDRLATVITAEAGTLGIPKKVADGFASWCDRISDRIEITAGINPHDKARKLALSGGTDHKTDYPFNEGVTYDADEIGEEVGGSSEGDADESYMRGEFSQQEHRELREKQEAGNLADVNTAPRSPRPGIQASLDYLNTAVLGGSFTAKHGAKLAEALCLAADIAKVEEGEDEDEDDKEAGKKKAAYFHGYNLDI